MSESRKEPEKKPNKISFWLTKKALVLGLSLLSISVVFGYITYDIGINQVEPEPTQQNPPTVMHGVFESEIPEIKFNVANFDMCVNWLIDYVKLSGLAGDQLSRTDELVRDDILRLYYGLGCNLVEDQLSQTDKYKHRNDSG